MVSAGGGRHEVETLGGAALSIQQVRHSAEAGLTETEIEKLAAAEEFLRNYTDDIGGDGDE